MRPPLHPIDRELYARLRGLERHVAGPVVLVMAPEDYVANSRPRIWYGYSVRIDPHLIPGTLDMRSARTRQVWWEPGGAA